MSLSIDKKLVQHYLATLHDSVHQIKLTEQEVYSSGIIGRKKISVEYPEDTSHGTHLTQSREIYNNKRLSPWYYLED